MSTWLVISVRDAAVGAFMQPFVVRSKGEAVRSFIDAVNDTKMEFGRHPDDYALFYLGEWDTDSGMLKPAMQPELIITANECLAHNIDTRNLRAVQ